MLACTCQTASLSPCWQRPCTNALSSAAPLRQNESSSAAAALLKTGTTPIAHAWLLLWHHTASRAARVIFTSCFQRFRPWLLSAGAARQPVHLCSMPAGAQAPASWCTSHQQPPSAQCPDKPSAQAAGIPGASPAAATAHTIHALGLGSPTSTTCARRPQHLAALHWCMQEPPASPRQHGYDTAAGSTHAGCATARPQRPGSTTPGSILTKTVLTHTHNGLPGSSPAHRWGLASSTSRLCRDTPRPNSNDLWPSRSG